MKQVFTTQSLNHVVAKSLKKTVSLVNSFVGTHQKVRSIVAQGNAEKEALILVDILKVAF